MRKIYLLKSTSILILILTFTLQVFCQKAPMRYGKIDIEDLKMTVYEKDTTAEAVILCDYGVFSPEQLQFTRHCRIKILKKEGTSYATLKVNSSSEIMLKAKCYNLVDGEIETTKMKKESIFKEKIENELSATRFTVPNAKVGSIIEYEYTIPWIPYEWEFQKSIPVVWSELIMYQHDNFTYRKTFFGYEPLSVNEKSRWIAKDLPAFRSEPYMNSRDNYITKFEFDVIKVFYTQYSTTWDKVNETLTKDEDFGGRLKTASFLNTKAKQIKEYDISNLQKAKRAYELVKSNITWDERYRKYAYKPLSNAFNREKNGSSADINLTLVALLKRIGFDAYPVVLSTRKRGLISPYSPSLTKLNYVIAQVEIDGEKYLLDATEKLAPFGLLPERCINGDARIVDETNATWVKLETKNKSLNTTYTSLDLSPDGELNGNISYKMSEYAAYDFRKNLEDYTSFDEYIEYKESSNAGMMINDYEIENKDDIYLPVVTKYDVTLQNSTDVIGDNIYINPMLFQKMDDNPFKVDDRKYPVDYTYPHESTYILNLSIPEGYTVDKIPESAKVSLPNSKGGFLYSVSNTGNKIQITYKFNINDPIILSTEYKQLKEFYDHIIKKHSEMIILKKNEG